MAENSYTIEEFRQAMLEVGWHAQEPVMLPKIIAQMDKNRAVKQGTGFTEKQVRDVLTSSLRENGIPGIAPKSYYRTVELYVNDVINRLCGSENNSQLVEGGVYRYPPKNTLYRRQQGRWQAFGMSGSWDDMHLPVPLDELERVL